MNGPLFAAAPVELEAAVDPVPVALVPVVAVPVPAITHQHHSSAH